MYLNQFLVPLSNFEKTKKEVNYAHLFMLTNFWKSF